jgi:hypothetical protein
MEGHIIHKGNTRNAYKIYTGKFEVKTIFCEIRCTWEDNIAMFIAFWNS